MCAKVSIIVPVYKVEPYIHRCMNSLINQTLKDIEIILVDDESPDNCGNTCDEYSKKDQRIKVIHKKNQGLGMARNSGIEIATGEYIAFVDSDDYISLDIYDKLYSKAILESADTCFCSYNWVDVNGNIKKDNMLPDKNIYIGDAIIKDFLINMLGSKPSSAEDRNFGISVWRAIYSRDIIINNNIRFCSERELISEDIIFHIDYLIYSKKVTIVKEALYNYCQNNKSLTLSYIVNRFEKNKILYFEIIRKIQNIGIVNLAELRISRAFLGAVRSCIGEEVKYSSKNGKQITLQNIKSICNDNLIQKVLDRYPIYQLPLKHKVFCIFMKLKMPIILYMLVKLKDLK